MVLHPLQLRGVSGGDPRFSLCVVQVFGFLHSSRSTAGGAALVTGGFGFCFCVGILFQLSQSIRKFHVWFGILSFWKYKGKKALFKHQSRTSCRHVADKSIYQLLFIPFENQVREFFLSLKQSAFYNALHLCIILLSLFLSVPSMLAGLKQNFICKYAPLCLQYKPCICF